MAMKNEVRYIQFRTEGTAARKAVSPAPFENTLKLPRRVKRKRLVLRLDPVAILGTAVALGMLIAMAVGLVRLNGAVQEQEQMARYVQQLESQNSVLERTYYNNYDLEELERLATAMGLVPKSEVTQVTIPVEVPAQEPQGFFQKIADFFADLFA